MKMVTTTGKKFGTEFFFAHMSGKAHRCLKKNPNSVNVGHNFLRPIFKMAAIARSRDLKFGYLSYLLDNFKHFYIEIYVFGYEKSHGRHSKTFRRHFVVEKA